MILFTRILVFRKCRLKDLRCIFRESLSYEIDSLGSAVGNNHLVWGNAVERGNLLFKLRGGGRRIVTDTIHSAGKMGIKSVVTEMVIDIRTKVYPNILVLVCIVAVAAEHFL